MIRSMTGYGRAEVRGVRLSLTVECKSLNHRHLDIVVKLPRAFSALELDARRVIQGAVQRGRVEVGVSAAPVEGTLFFAGEATDTEGEAATVTGALQSGERAANEIIESWR